VHKEAGQRSKIQGARRLDLKDLLLLPSSPPSLPRLLVLITLGLEKKKSKGCSSTHNPSITDSPPFTFPLSLFVLPPGHNPSVTDSPHLLFLSLFVLTNPPPFTFPHSLYASTQAFHSEREMK